MVTSSSYPVFVNKVLLEHSHEHVFARYPKMLLLETAEISYCNRDCIHCKA